MSYVRWGQKTEYGESPWYVYWSKRGESIDNQHLEIADEATFTYGQLKNDFLGCIAQVMGKHSGVRSNMDALILVEACLTFMKSMEHMFCGDE